MSSTSSVRSSRRSSLLVGLAIVGASAVATPRAALASPTFPPVVQETFSLSREPACTLCHNSLQGGIGTAVTPVGVYLRSRGASAGDTNSLKGALAAMLAEKHDADGDGVTDVDELKAGTDPNGSAVGYGEPAVYGCGARVASGNGTSGAFAAIVAFAGALVFRRRRSGAKA